MIWELNGFTEKDILENESFVYLITNKISGRKYIGKKFIYSKRSTKQKNGRRKHTKTESNWKTYQGSCSELNRDIEVLGSEKFKKEILFLFKTRREANYKEAELQFKHDVLNSKLPSGEYEFYNANILTKFFRSKK